MKKDILNFLVVLVLFFIAIISISPARKKKVMPACFNAPLYLYNEELKMYYRQDWCKFGKEPIYYENIPAEHREKEIEI